MKEIEKIIAAYDQADWDREKAALGTVVKVEESAYRRVGARLFVTSQGNWVGGISGGCLEGDALKRAQIAINKNKSSIVVYDTMDDDSHQIGVGLGCNGRIEVMFTPVEKDQPDNPVEFLRSITHTRRPEILLQILQNDASEDGLLGSFYPESKISQLAADTGIAPQEIHEAIDKTRKKRKSLVFPLQNQKGETFEILVEHIRPKVKLICAGDNYDVNAFVSIARELGWEIHVAGKLRKLDKTVFDLADSVRPYADFKDLGIDEHTAVVLMSHDYKTDLTLLQMLREKEVPYIGLLGPRKRMIKMQNELAEEKPGIDLPGMENLYSPTGLDIGAESPEEIALSIVAEITAVMRDRSAQFLREREGPIHERD